MSNTSFKIIHKNSNIKNKKPSNLDFGEIAINYNAGNENIFIKNSNQDIVSITTPKNTNHIVAFNDAGDCQYHKDCVEIGEVENEDRYTVAIYTASKDRAGIMSSDDKKKLEYSYLTIKNTRAVNFTVYLNGEGGNAKELPENSEVVTIHNTSSPHKDFIDVFSLNKVSSCRKLFINCDTIEEIDLRHFNTSQVADMNEMFRNCKKLVTVDISNLNTSNVTDLSDMFVNCESLKNVNFCSFDTHNVIDMHGMFDTCTALEKIDISGFNTSNVIYMNGMFGETAIKELDLRNFDTSNVTNMYAMFYMTPQLESVVLTSFNTKKVTNMAQMFNGSSKITHLDLSSFEADNVQHMYYMFKNCSSLESIDLSKFEYNTTPDSAHNVNDMFDGCTNLKSIKCPKVFYDWCIKYKNTIKLPDYLVNNSKAWTITNKESIATIEDWIKDYKENRKYFLFRTEDTSSYMEYTPNRVKIAESDNGSLGDWVTNSIWLEKANVNSAGLMSANDKILLDSLAKTYVYGATSNSSFIGSISIVNIDSDLTLKGENSLEKLYNLLASLIQNNKYRELDNINFIIFNNNADTLMFRFTQSKIVNSTIYYLYFTISFNGSLYELTCKINTVGEVMDININKTDFV